jgi:predicted ATP-grasp superfamily ATP-dependent carboligase
MRIFVYEFVTGGGCYSASAAMPPESLVAEGRAMLQALVADFAAIDGVQVEVLADRRFIAPALSGVTIHSVASAGAEQAALAALAAAADWSVVIAPEFGGHLLARVEWAEQAGGRLLSPSSRIVALTADKQATATHLAEHGVPAPYGWALLPGDSLPKDFPYPAVLKPRDGAGSQGIEWIESPASATERSAMESPMRLESYCPGMPVSVAFLCGSTGIVPLAPCRQYLSDDRRFVYCGGGLPLARALAERAGRLATRAVATLAAPVGYLGVDLVLGPDPSGAGDVIVEINPRLTSSYVGLRALARGNLAAAMLTLAEGGKVELSWHGGPIQFEASGRMTRAAAVASA